MIPPRFYLPSDSNWQSLSEIEHSTRTTLVLEKLGRKEAKQRKNAQQSAEKNKKKLSKAELIAQQKEKFLKTDISSVIKKVNNGKEDNLRERLRSKIASMQSQRKEQQRETDLARKAAKQALPVSTKSKVTLGLEDNLDLGNQVLERTKIDCEYIAPEKGAKIKTLQKAVFHSEQEKKKIAKIGDEKERLEKMQKAALEKAAIKLAGGKVKDDMGKLKKTKKMMEKKKENNRNKWLDKEQKANEGRKKEEEGKEERKKGRGGGKS